MSDDGAKQVVRLGLKPLDPMELVSGDPVLSRAALVKALGAHAAQVLGAGRMRRLAPGGRLYQAGDPADHVCFVVRGDVSLVAADGLEAVRLSTGDLCGTGAALGTERYSLTAGAVSQVDVLEIPGEALARLVPTLPGLAAALEEAHERNRGAASELEDFLDRW